MWATQVAGGDEPPSVLSDNLQGLAIKPGLSWFLASGRPGLEVEPLKGHKLVSQSVALSRRLPLRWKAARFRFVIKRAGR
jgi:hypothetical protein